MPGDLGLFLAISGYLGLFLAISDYLGLSLAISSYLWLSLAIPGYPWLSLVISDYFYQVSNIRVQVETGESKLLLFPNLFLIFFFFLHERSLEELALLKTYLAKMDLSANITVKK